LWFGFSLKEAEVLKERTYSFLRNAKARATLKSLRKSLFREARE